MGQYKTDFEVLIKYRLTVLAIILQWNNQKLLPNFAKCDWSSWVMHNSWEESKEHSDCGTMRCGFKVVICDNNTLQDHTICPVINFVLTRKYWFMEINLVPILQNYMVSLQTIYQSMIRFVTQFYIRDI